MGRFLQRIIKYPPTRDIQADEKQLVWKFRFSLMSEKKALTKFVRSVDWSDIQVSKSIHMCIRGNQGVFLLLLSK